MQSTSRNTLVYADAPEADTSSASASASASTIASTLRQMSMSFGVAAAGLTTAVFVADRFRAGPAELMSGLHRAFLVLGGFTILSTAVFWRLKRDDGGNVSHQHVSHTL